MVAVESMHYFPPTFKKVALEASGVYYATFIGILGILPTSTKLPLQTGTQNGYACVPLEYNVPSTIFFYLVFLPLLLAIPLIYVSYVFLDVFFWRKLIPRDPRAKQFTFYFHRVVIIFFLWWVPALTLIYVAVKSHPWVKLAGSIWVHTQTIASVAMAMTKPDILIAAQEMVTCSSSSLQQSPGKQTWWCFPGRKTQLSTNDDTVESTTLEESDSRGSTRYVPPRRAGHPMRGSSLRTFEEELDMFTAVESEVWNDDGKLDGVSEEQHDASEEQQELGEGKADSFNS